MLPAFRISFNSRCVLCSCKSYPRKWLSDVVKKKERSPKEVRKSVRHKINYYFRTNPRLMEIKPYIPEKYWKLTRVPPDNLYLVDSEIAKDAINIIYPLIKDNENQIVSETNAGLGFLTSEMLDKGVKMVRLYEACPEFRESLREFDVHYPGRVELFTRNFYHSSVLDYFDKLDNGNRVLQVLKGVPKKEWTDDPVMTVTGPMPNSYFIKFLLKSLALQSHFVKCGRIQLFPFMTPKEYTILTADQTQNLHTYTWHSVLFNLFFDWTLLAKYPRQVFLPWEVASKCTRPRYASKVDPNCMYLVQINFKKELPVSWDELRFFYFFTKHFFGRGKRKVIPMLEKWIDNFGERLFLPQTDQGPNFPSDVNIFTESGDLSPTEILAIYREFSHHQKFEESPLLAMMEAELLKTETVESDVADAIDVDNVTPSEDLEENLKDRK